MFSLYRIRSLYRTCSVYRQLSYEGVEFLADFFLKKSRFSTRYSF